MLKLIFLLIIFLLCVLSLQMFHPLALSLNLMIVCIMYSALLIKLTFSWLFYLLVLMFLGGIMVVFIYMASLAANEKMTLYPMFLFNAPAMALIFSIFILDESTLFKITSTHMSAGDGYSLFFIPMMILCFGLLFLAMISAINLMKFEEGPMVKRL